MEEKRSSEVDGVGMGTPVIVMGSHNFSDNRFRT